jgi:hypothetical protein
MLPNRIPAASSGTMNNLTIGGIDPRTNQTYAYYETIAGGSGARPNGNGVSGVHTHMTNSLNTPVEALEYAYPFRVHQYSYRKGSGGNGLYKGGDGIIREIELLSDAQITLLADRRILAPYGLQGGSDAAKGRSLLNGTERPGKCNIEAKAGSRLRIETPGGGGWGKRETSQFEAAVEAVITGNIKYLEELLNQNPDLIRTRSTSSQHATLLHYVSANGVEDHLQKTPPNAPLIASTLLNAGAEVDAIAFCYGQSTTLGLVASSVYPERAGVQVELIEILLKAGASIEGALMPALNNGRLIAAEALVQRGAKIENIEAAAALGYLDLVSEFLPQSSTTQQEHALVLAAAYDRTNVAEFLLQKGVNPTTAPHMACHAGHLDTIKMLLKHLVPLEVKNRFGGTVLGQAMWSAANEPHPNHPEIIKALVSAGAKPAGAKPE